MTETYTGRYVVSTVVEKVDGGGITMDTGWSCFVPEDIRHLLPVGKRFEQETVQISLITGWRIDGVWYHHKSDQDLERERQEGIESRKREDRERLETHRSEWIGRTENLPPWLQERIQHFHERGGETFELEGWGYELAIAELAVLYDRHPEITRDTKWGDYPQEIVDLDHKLGCSGNQHDLALALVQAHRDGQSLAGTVGGLSPITGDPFYEGKR